MKEENLIKLIQNPHNIASEEVEALKQLCNDYPYFQAVYTLIAKAYYDADRPGIEPVIQLAAIYATNRSHLKRLLEEEVVAPTPEEATIDENLKDEDETEAQNFINGYINNIRKKSKKTINKQKSLAQIHIIEEFVRKNLRFTPASLKDLPSEDFQTDLAKESTTFHDELITENLAEIMSKQGKIQRAIEIYNKLLLKFPEKKAYFTSKIMALKNEK
ncbi:MAG: hypothetical protein MI674_05515 [Cytophagales bacterium]|nr:hypothetical protein [Cytophagales bacterium]